MFGAISYVTCVAFGFAIAVAFRPESVYSPEVQKDGSGWVRDLLVPVGPSEPQKQTGDLYLKALVVGRESHRSIFLFFGSPGEGPTEQMKQLLHNPEVADRLGKYIPLDVDVTLRPDLADKYEVHGTPVIIFINFREFPLKRRSGVMSLEEFMEFLGNF